MAKNSVSGDIAKQRVAECDRQRGLKNRGSSHSGAQFFSAKATKPGSIGKKGNEK